MRRTRKTVSEIELDLGRYELRRQGRRVKLEKKPMELLIFLVSRRDQMVSRQDQVLCAPLARRRFGVFGASARGWPSCR
jgi:DNA-binding response OmpR family regulator